MQFRQILEPGALKQLLGNTSDATLQLGPFAGDDDAAAVTFGKANFRPGLPGDAEVRFVFTQVTAWNAESFVAVNPIISEARRDRGKTELAVDWCCGPPVPLRIPPPAPRSASNTGRVAGIAAAVVVAVRTPFHPRPYRVTAAYHPFHPHGIWTHTVSASRYGAARAPAGCTLCTGLSCRRLHVLGFVSSGGMLPVPFGMALLPALLFGNPA